MNSEVKNRLGYGVHLLDAPTIRLSCLTGFCSVHIKWLRRSNWGIEFESINMLITFSSLSILSGSRNALEVLNHSLDFVTEWMRPKSIIVKEIK